MSNRTIEDVRRELAECHEQRDRLPQGLLDRFPNDDELKEISRLELQMSDLEYEIVDIVVIEPRAEIKAEIKMFNANLKRSAEARKLFSNKPKADTDPFLYLRGAANHYLREQGAVASIGQLWDFMKSNDSDYKYSIKDKGFSGAGNAAMTKENFRKNLRRYGYKGSK